MSVMGAGGTDGYIAESPDPQWSRFDFRGGGATTAMKETCSSCDERLSGRKPGSEFSAGWSRDVATEQASITAGLQRRSTKLQVCSYGRLSSYSRRVVADIDNGLS